MKKNIIRTLYLYIFAGVGLVLLTVGVVRFIDMGLRATIFQEADRADQMRQVYYEIPRVSGNLERYEDAEEITEEEIESLRMMIEDYENRQAEWEGIDQFKAQRQREASSNLAFILVGLPLYLYHWATIKKED